MTCEVCQEREADVCNECIHEITVGSAGDDKRGDEIRIVALEEAVEKAIAMLAGAAPAVDEAVEILKEVIS